MENRLLPGNQWGCRHALIYAAITQTMSLTLWLTLVTGLVRP